MYGKDARPEETIKKIKQILRRVGMSIEEVSWKHPVADVWSVHIRETHCHALSVNGKGTTKTLALASALGEFMERVVTGYSFSEFALLGLTTGKKFLFYPDEKWFTSKKGLLNTELHALYNPTGELKTKDFVDRISGGCGKDMICSIPFRRVPGKKTAYFPISILDNLYASNGMAAGNTKEEACVQALSEVLERYVKTLIIRKGIALPDIPKKCYTKFPQVVRALDVLKGAGFRVLVKDASLGGRYPVTNVTIVDKKTKKCFLAFGAHPSFEIALTRTVTELLQGQRVSAFCGLRKPSKTKKEVQEQSNLVSHFIDSSGLVSEDFFKKKSAYCFNPVDYVGTRKGEERFLLSIFRKAKRDVYINAVSIDGFYVCRAVVPKWSEVYPVEDLAYANNNRARGLVGYVSNLPACTQAELKKALSFIDAGIVGENEIVADVLGIALDAGSPWERLCFGELKLLLLIALKKKEQARVQLEWCFDVGCVRKKMKDVYECLWCLLTAEDTKGFGKSVLARANKLFNGKDVFSDLFSARGVMCGTGAHKNIQDSFSKSRRIMRG